MKTIALIVAAGASSRFGGEVPKPYIELNGKAVLRRTVEAFLTHPGIDGVRVVISRQHHPLYRKLINGLTLFPPVMGGPTRQYSVRLGLEAIARANPARVLIHDGARPNVSHALISRVLEKLGEYPAVLPTVTLVDTLRSSADMQLVARDGLLAAQTPQGFDFNAILAAHRQFRDTPVTDDIALAQSASLAVGVVEGERTNLKITTQDDLSLMSALTAATYETRVGMGTDVHSFIPFMEGTPSNQRHITVCGVKIPFEFRLNGHSDSDVGLHAVVDAILGAVGSGDIGQHFPSDDPQWAAADSSRFLIDAFKRMREKDGELVNIDVTIIGEKPRIGQYRNAMAQRMADILKLDVGRINVKATTTERLGFLGRGEGLAAQAVVAVRFPVKA